LEYGYDSPTSFNRAFQSVHGVAPSTARGPGVELKAFPPISFTMSIKGEVAMNYRIEKRDAFRIIGYKEQMDLNIEENFIKVPLFWQQIGQGGLIPKLCQQMNQSPMGVLGVSTCMNGKDLDYYIAVASDLPPQEGMVAYEVPAATWAIFQCIGPVPQALQALQKRIITEWLPTSGYEYGNAPDIEVYSDGNQQSLTYQTEIWLPVVPKEGQKTES